MPVQITCERCGKTFSVKPTKAPTARFCSYACRINRVSLTCDWCGKPFEIYASRSDQRFCSPRCRQEGRFGTPAERLERRIDKSGGPDSCWEIAGFGNTNGGHVFIKIENRPVYAHRLAWELANGPIPEGMVVCHECDNPRCCNPAHLWLGTVADNNADRSAKGRSFRGKQTTHRPTP